MKGQHNNVAYQSKKKICYALGFINSLAYPWRASRRLTLSISYLTHFWQQTTLVASCDVSFNANYGVRNQNLVEPAHCTNRKASKVHWEWDSSRQKGDKGKPNILVSFVSNIAALRLMWHHNFSLSNFEEMMAFKRLFLVYKVHFFSFEQDLLYKKTKKGKVMMLCIAL